ncbi:hypothetical protein OHA37_22345 [Streptomyces sp. NBC_00335]|uniref:hypothetical protein n=1 Tax=unclassified Streptomyces TaxID=2593676 RepID=UPI00225A4870|nr:MULTISPECIES: hypothetical protein [unclassified Streptomyces]MCX5406602.1 hypothetical protein [Streptomyces sp. NBC_00086]
MQVALIHEQLAVLAGTSRETLLRHARGRIAVLDAERLKGAAGWRGSRAPGARHYEPELLARAV